MIKLFSISLFFFLLFTAACTPYNSNEKNIELLQGKWHLIDLRYTHPDSIKENILLDTAFLTFRGDTIEEQINGNQARRYSFEVKKYVIYWSADSSRIAKTTIMSLSPDTFRMKSFVYDWVYIKEKVE